MSSQLPLGATTTTTKTAAAAAAAAAAPATLPANDVALSSEKVEAAGYAAGDGAANSRDDVYLVASSLSAAEQSSSSSPHSSNPSQQPLHSISAKQPPPPPPFVPTPLTSSQTPASSSGCTGSIERCTDSITAWTDEFQRKEEERDRTRRQREEDEGDRPDPTWKRKGMIPLVALILSWVYVVYVWRICVPAIQQRDSSIPSTLVHPRPLATRATGIGLLIGFHIIYLLTVWSYIKILCTGPGLVVDHVPKEEMPKPYSVDEGQGQRGQYQQQQEQLQQQQWMEQGLGGPYTGPVEETTEDRNASTIFLRGDDEAGTGPVTLPAVPTQHSQISPPLAAPMDNGGDQPPIDSVLPAIIGPIGASMVAAAADDDGALLTDAEQTKTIAPKPAQSTLSEALAMGPQLSGAAPCDDSLDDPPPSRRPPFPDYAPLRKSNRYCYRCSVVKPYRAHHCRHCGTCIEKMDHHCPWTGGCVGGSNHKFYYNFVFWVTVLEFYVLVSGATLFNRGIQGSIDGWDFDGFVISLFPICAIFILFTLSLLVTHTWLIATNQTTIEHLATSRLARKEEIALATWFSRKGGWTKAQKRLRQQKPQVGRDLERQDRGRGAEKDNVDQFGTESARYAANATRTDGFRMIREKRQMQKDWNSEWGKLRKELNLWKVEGNLPLPHADQIQTRPSPLTTTNTTRYRKLNRIESLHADWSQTMGSSSMRWFLPIGRPGLDPSSPQPLSSLPSSSSSPTSAGQREQRWLTYPPNPRFGPEGQWRRRCEWPEELR